MKISDIKISHNRYQYINPGYDQYDNKYDQSKRSGNQMHSVRGLEELSEEHPKHLAKSTQSTSQKPPEALSKEHPRQSENGTRGTQ